MKFTALPNVAMILVMCASLIAALPVDAEGHPIRGIKSLRSSGCSMSKIRDCVNDTGLESSLCFAQVCSGTQKKMRVIKRQDQCTEENLLQCAVMEWREAEVCFQELCL
ncbi:hypothetical protein F4781DRAFT_388991 [Annulohypoxylon bovei var. microspora]|nr:hypothetical protein F4781DRAFT_388991 [Annulohypoxylon bovei var. microspora]